VNVTITTASDAGSQTSGPVTYTYINATTVVTNDPSISYLSPNSGRADQDIEVTIYGNNFGASQGSVRFGGYTASIINWSDGMIRVHAPQLGAIPADVSYQVVVTRSADGKTASASYLYLAPPSTGGGTTTTTGMPMEAWAGLVSANGLLAFFVKRRFL
ncbi:MAG: IPT/TIG domain-containing protein, partial [Patescibacteria group bacterium]